METHKTWPTQPTSGPSLWPIAKSLTAAKAHIDKKISIQNIIQVALFCARNKGV